MKSRQPIRTSSKLVKRAARFRLGQYPDDVTAATKFALRSVARRYLQLSEEISEFDEQLDRLVAEAAPELIAVEGVGTDSAITKEGAQGTLPTPPELSRRRRRQDSLTS